MNALDHGRFENEGVLDQEYLDNLIHWSLVWSERPSSSVLESIGVYIMSSMSFLNGTESRG